MNMRITGKGRALALFCALCILLTAWSAQAAQASVRANVNVTILKDAKKGAETVGFLSQGDIAEKLGTRGNYTLISRSGITGYVLSSAVSNYSASAAQNSATPTKGDVSIQDENKTYIANALVNVRLGPSTEYKRIGALKKNEAVQALHTVGKWTQIAYQGGKAYVYSSYLSSASQSGNPSLPASPKGVVYFIRNTEVLKSAASSASGIGYAFLGGRAVKKGANENRHAYISINDIEGYVEESSIVEVAGEGAHAFNASYGWAYVGSAPTIAYVVPIEDKKYRRGVFDPNEHVFIMGDNGYWFLVYANGDMGFVPKRELLSRPVSGSPVPNAGKYEIGALLTVGGGGAIPYGSTMKTPYYPPYSSEKAYGTIEKGTEVIFARAAQSLALIVWQDHKTPNTGAPARAPFMHMAYVDISDLEQAKGA